jgi:hypothetical protein
MIEMEQSDVIPFQYIVTTTTLPSSPLRKKAITRLSLSGGIGSLFKRQLEIGSSETKSSNLFD